MANTYLYNLTTETPLLTDNLIITGGSGHNVDYKALLSAVATLFIESYTGSSLAGASQSVKSAFSAVQKILDERALVNRGTLPTGTDLNDVHATGTYGLAGSYTYSNMPYNVTFGTLVNISPNTSPLVNYGFQTQIILNNAIIAFRFFANNAWYAWHRVTDGITSNTYTVNGVTFSFRRNGRLVVVTSSGTPTSAVTTSAYAGSATIADAYKPVSAFTANVAATPSTNIQVNIGTTGTFQYGYAGTQIGTSTNIRVCFSYYAVELDT